MLEEARSVCDRLVVGLQTDPTIDRPSKGKPVQTIFERFVQLRGCRFVDEIVVYERESELIDILLAYPISVRIIGADYIGKDFTGKDECMRRGIEIYYNKRDHRYSTTELRGRIYDHRI
jgi:glycerol-3-phosphate cytidylyltransferase